MPSLRGLIFRRLLRYVVRPKFWKAGASVADLREVAVALGKRQSLPHGIAVKPAMAGGVSGEWLIPRNADDSRTILYFHGGGFIMGSPETHSELAARIALASRARALSIDYRLAPEHPFPAAVEDAVAAFQWLLDDGYPAVTIVIGGDSAGGSLALQTLISLRDERKPLPRAAFMMSPQTEWLRFDGESYTTRAKQDPFVTRKMCQLSASLYIGESDADKRSLSLRTIDLARLPRMLIHVGDCEVLLSDAVALAEKARIAGVDATLAVWPGMWHVFQSSAAIVPEARRAIDKIGAFVRE
jgi:monoterpene epsilon-lactone hydrolase